MQLLVPIKLKSYRNREEKEEECGPRVLPENDFSSFEQKNEISRKNLSRIVRKELNFSKLGLNRIGFLDHEQKNPGFWFQSRWAEKRLDWSINWQKQSRSGPKGKLRSKNQIVSTKKQLTDLLQQKTKLWHG